MYFFLRVFFLKLKSGCRFYVLSRSLANAELLSGQILSGLRGLSNLGPNPPSSAGISFHPSLYFGWDGSLAAVERGDPAGRIQRGKRWNNNSGSRATTLHRHIAPWQQDSCTLRGSGLVMGIQGERRLIRAESSLIPSVGSQVLGIRIAFSRRLDIKSRFHY